jgi:hypothetical protein
MVFDSHGGMGGSNGLLDGHTRYLSRLELLIDGTQSLLLGWSVRDDNLTLTADLTNPGVVHEGHLVLPRDTSPYRAHRRFAEGRRASADRRQQ